MNICAWPISTGNPYLSILYNELSNEVSIVSHKKCLYGLRKNISVVHLHWINFLVYHNRFIASILCLLFYIYVKFLKLLKKRLVWTMHNSKPFTHIKKNVVITNFVVKCILNNFDKIIVHSNFQKNHIDKKYWYKVKHIPHHNYSKIIHHKAKELTEEILFFGGIDRYKGIDSLVRVFDNSNYQNYRLSIVGKCSDQDLLDELNNSGKNNINIENVYLSDDQLHDRISKSSLIILPFKKITNSGSLILSLSLLKKVVVPKNMMTDELISLYPSLKKVIFQFTGEDNINTIIEHALHSEVKFSYFEEYLQNTNIDNISMKYLDIYTGKI